MRNPPASPIRFLQPIRRTLPNRTLAAAGSLAAFLLGACGTGLVTTPPPAPAPGPTPVLATPQRDPPAIHWSRTAAEHEVVFLQTFAFAGDRVEDLARGLERGSWAVILDADETLLDNAEYQSRRARLGLGFTVETWNEWVREEAAGALPGAVGFVSRVRGLGGRIAVVTNRDDVVCDPTRRNLEAVGIAADVVLCRAPGERRKEERYQAVQEGDTPAQLPPLEVVAWIGDNIEDFPGGSQALRSGGPGAFADFGRRFFILPNPMYGSWEANPPG